MASEYKCWRKQWQQPDTKLLSVSLLQALGEVSFEWTEACQLDSDCVSRAYLVRAE